MNRIFEAQCRMHAQLREYAMRIDRARAVVSEALATMRNPYIAFSTGKDSTVMADLVWRQSPDVPAVYFDADCAFPESEAMLSRYEEAGWPIVRWKCEPFFETLCRVGGPTSDRCEAETMRSTVYRPIKSLLAEHHFDGVFVGLRTEESVGRRKLVGAKGQLFWVSRDGLWECLPVAHLTYADVWAYIVGQGLEYCPVYDRLMELGVQPEQCRLSYWAGESSRALGRWAILRRGWPELFDRFAAEFPEVRCYV